MGRVFLIEGIVWIKVGRWEGLGFLGKCKKVGGMEFKVGGREWRDEVVEISKG